jgi:class I fructose-bisphosphate aldolase
MYERFRELAEEAKAVGLAVVLWAYVRGSQLPKDVQTAIDVIGYAAQISAQLGAHIIKVKLPSEKIAQDAARKVYEVEKIPIGTLTERVRHVVQCAFNGRRIVIFSGGDRVDDTTIYDEMRAIRDGGGFGSIIGRNSFQRKHDDAVKMLNMIQDILVGKAK